MIKSIVKNRMYTKITYGMIFCIFMVSCNTTGISSKASRSWSYNRTPRTTLQLGSIQIDKSASYSVEHEVAVLLPLLFLEKQLVFSSAGEEADYIVDVHGSERDYPVGWNTRKSLSLEVYIRSNKAARQPSAAADETPNDAEAKPSLLIAASPQKDDGFKIVTPDAAARVRAAGKLGFSSSKNLEYLLRVCIQKSVAQLKRSQSWKER
ncbi:MAG: hypothetical protein LBD20_04365 [Spirochaetaceae bacterium]|nr:hypothetical protein [Spirochaetaceae bacterium]